MIGQDFYYFAVERKQMRVRGPGNETLDSASGTVTIRNAVFSPVVGATPPETVLAPQLEDVPHCETRRDGNEETRGEGGAETDMNEAKETNRERARRVAKAIAAGGVPKQITDEATPEEIAADKRRSLALLAASGASLSADDMELAFAIQRETNARANIDVLSDQIIALWFDNRPKDIEVLKEQLHVQTVALARALRDQGRLDEAVEVCLSMPRNLRLAAKRSNGPMTGSASVRTSCWRRLTPPVANRRRSFRSGT